MRLPIAIVILLLMFESTASAMPLPAAASLFLRASLVSIHYEGGYYSRPRWARPRHYSRRNGRELVTECRYERRLTRYRGRYVRRRIPVCRQWGPLRTRA